MRSGVLLLLVLPLGLLTACGDDDDDDFTGPTSELCNSLTRIDIPGSVNGTLTVSDMQLDDGSFVDRYRIQVNSTQNVRIDMTSAEFDTYLILLTADEDFVAQNDDGGTDLNARLEENLTAGCYIVLANGFDEGEIGSYSIAVSTF